jgi:hypothetical protein
VQDKIRAACQATVKKGIEYQHRDLVDNAVDKMKKHRPGDAEAFAIEAEMSYAKAMADARAYAKACRDCAKKVAKDDPRALHDIAKSLAEHFRSDEYAMKQAEEIAAEAAKIGNSYGYYLTYAGILVHNGKKDEARRAAQKSLELAKEEGEQAVRNVERFIQQIQG